MYFGIMGKEFYLDVIKNKLCIHNDGNVIGNYVYKSVNQMSREIYNFH